MVRQQQFTRHDGKVRGREKHGDGSNRRKESGTGRRARERERRARKGRERRGGKKVAENAFFTIICTSAAVQQSLDIALTALALVFPSLLLAFSCKEACSCRPDDLI